MKNLLEKLLSQVLVASYLSPVMLLEREYRQGDPIAGCLCILAIETLHVSLAPNINKAKAGKTRISSLKSKNGNDHLTSFLSCVQAYSKVKPNSRIL